MWRRKLPFDGSLQGKPQLSSPSMLPQHYGHFKMKTYNHRFVSIKHHLSIEKVIDPTIISTKKDEILQLSCI